MHATAPARGLAFLTAALLIATAPACSSAPTPEEHLDAVRRRLVEGQRIDQATPVLAALDHLAADNTVLLVQLDGAARDLAERSLGLGRELGGDGAPAGGYLDPLTQETLRALTFDYLKVTRLCARIADDHFEVDELELASPTTRANALGLRLAAALVGLDVTTALIAAFDDVAGAKDALNQPHERDHIPARFFSNVKHASRSLRMRARVRDLIERFQAPEVQRLVVADAEPPPLEASQVDLTPGLAWLARRIYASPAYDELRKDESLARVLTRGPEKLGHAAGEGAVEARELVYPIQVFVSGIIGDAETSNRAPYIQPAQAALLRGRLRPGDILLRRCDFFVSNAFLPGWWGHAAVFTGARADLVALGLAEDPRVAPHLDAMTGGHELIEAVGEGVRIDGLAHFMEADHVAALRPKWRSKAAQREVVARAFAELGKAYDFDFDFTTDQTVVCSEVVYRAYAGTHDFPLKKRFGRFTLTPDDIASHSAATGGPLTLVYFFKAGRVAPPKAFAAMLGD